MRLGNRFTLLVPAFAALALLSAGQAFAQDPASRSVRGTVNSGDTASVAITLTPPPGSATAVVTDTPPTGWTISDISDQGVLNEMSNVITWTLPNGSNLERVLSYRITPPPGNDGFQDFEGTYSYNGAMARDISGDRYAIANSASGAFATRALTTRIVDGSEMLSVSLTISSLPVDSEFLVIDEQIPFDWPVTNVNEGGTYNNTSTTDSVRWLFFIVPDLPLVLSYDIEVPADEKGQFNFYGEEGYRLNSATISSHPLGDQRGFALWSRTAASAILGKVELDATEEAAHDVNASAGLDVGDAIGLVNAGN